MPTPQLQSKLAKWYHPPVKPVNRGDDGIGTGRVGHPPRCEAEIKKIGGVVQNPQDPAR